MKIEVFFDYACPYCLKGHEFLKALLKDNPRLEIVWNPCEAHPRPESYGPHSDLCIQGFYYAMEHGCDIWEYHERMYRAALTERVDIEDAAILSETVRGLLDTKDFLNALNEGRYLDVQQESNRCAYQKNGVWAVPAYRMNGRKLDAVENIGITKEELKAFIEMA